MYIALELHFTVHIGSLPVDFKNGYGSSACTWILVHIYIFICVKYKCFPVHNMKAY